MDQTVKYLQQRITATYNKNIKTANDCEKLAKDIQIKTQVILSSQTLRRFFELIPSKSSFSNYTLDILSQYVGYKDFHTFCESYKSQELDDFYSCDHKSEEELWSRSKQLCIQISESPELLVNIHNRLMKLPKMRKYFMEAHPMRDLLGSVYSQYFATYLRYNTSVESQIFALSFLSFGSFLTGNKELFEVYYHQLSKLIVTKEIHVIPSGFKYGIELLYADFVGDEFLFSQIFSEMKVMRNKMISASQQCVCSFEMSVLEVLILTNRTKEIAYLLKNNTQQIGHETYFVPHERKNTHHEVWKILCAISYFKLGDTKKSEMFFENVNLDALDIGWKKYYSILYYSLQSQLKEVLDNQTLEQLFLETEFFQLKTLFQHKESELEYF